MIALGHRRFIAAALRGVHGLDLGVCAYAELGRETDLDGAIDDAERVVAALRSERARLGRPLPIAIERQQAELASRLGRAERAAAGMAR